MGYEQVAAQFRSRRANPIAAAAREASATRFAGLSTPQAAALARSSFPDLVAHADDGLPKLERGERVGRIVGDFAAAVSLPNGKRGVVESLTPISVDTSSGRVPIDLRLREARGELVPKTPTAGLKLSIPRQLSAAPALREVGVSLWPVDRHGMALPSASGVVDGATVFYGKSERPGAGVLDMDTLVKPETLGFSEETILRSERSPKSLFFQVGLPKGAHLSQPHGAGPVLVVRAGRVLATLAAPSAVDAEGASAPLSLSFSGDTLEIVVDRKPGQYRFPIAVDPTVTDWQLNVSSGKPTNWHFASGGPAFTGSEKSGGAGWTEHIASTYTESEWGAFEYTTQGISHIRSFSMKGNWKDPANVVNELLIVAPSKAVEALEILPSEWTTSSSWSRCAPEPECTGAQASGNSAEWIQNPNANGSGKAETWENTLSTANVTIEQASGPELTFNKTTPTVAGGMPNILYGSGSWLGPGTAFEANAYDPGVGISYFGIAGGMKGWAEKYPLLEKGECLGGVQCEQHFNQVIEYSPLLPDGEVSLEAIAYNSMNSYSMVWPLKIKVDGTAPHNIVVSGLPANHLIGFKPYVIKAEASDGSGALASSGVKSIGLAVDGRQIGTASGSCSPGPCTAYSGSWTINGNEFAGGEHSLEVTATDNAGNVAVEDVTITVPVAHPIELGPGEVTPRSGEYLLESTDVSAGEGLTVSRSYGSQHPTTGVGGPLGPQWAIGMGSVESLEVQPNGNVSLTDDSGRRVGFVKGGSGGFTSPPGDANLTLSFKEAGGVKEYVLSNSAKGTSTHFTLPSGGGSLWMPTIQEGTLATETTTYTYETVEVAGVKVTRPVKALAPVPAGVSCAPEMKAGCRALTFNYATSTTATGEGSSGWGDYNGNLTRVYLTSYEPVGKSMSTVTVAQYSYDTKGRLRAEWDPRISPALKVEYGYDAEGHVTALTPPGQETWAFVYGPTATDSTPGRLLRTVQAPASASLWSGSAPTNTAVPTLTPEPPLIGSSATASTGSWSGSPVAYRYQWQRCNMAGEACVAIPGAINEAYTPTVLDANRKLRVEVQAINGGGSSSVAYSAAARVVSSSLSYQFKFGSSGTGSGQFKWAQGVAVDGSGNVWVADTFNNRVQEFSSAGTFIREFGTTGSGNGQFVEPFGIAIDSEGHLLVTDAGNGRVQEFSSTGEYLSKFATKGSGAGQLTWPNGITITPEGNVWVADTLDNRIEEFSSTGTYIRVAGSAGSGAGQFSGPKSVASDAYGDIWVTDSKNNRVEEFSATGTYLGQFGSAGSGHGQFKETRGIAVDSSGDVWVTDKTNGRVQGFSASGEYLTQYGGGTEFNEPEGIAVTGSGKVYVADTSNYAIQALQLGNAPSFTFSATFAAYGSGVEPTAWQTDVTIDASGNLWVTDTVNNCVWEFSSSGVYLKKVGTVGSGNGQLKEPFGIAATSEGNLWVLDSGNSRAEEFEPNGKYIRQFGSAGSGAGQFSSPRDIVVLSNGNILISDEGNNRIQEFTSTGSFVREVNGGAGSYKLSSPTSVAVDAEGHLWVVDAGHNRVEEFSSTGEYMRQFGSAGSGRGQFNNPQGVTIDGSGDIWVADTFNDRIQGFSATGEFLAEYGGFGYGNGQFYDPAAITVSSTGVYYVLDAGFGRLQDFTVPISTSEPSAAPRTEGAAMSTVEYNVPVSGAGAPYEMSSAQVSKWSQGDVPYEAMAIFPPDEAAGWPSADYKRATVYYLDEKQRVVNVAAPSGGISTTEYNEANDVTRTLSADNRATALESAKSSEVANTLDTRSSYSSDGAELLGTLDPVHTVKLANGEEVSARQHALYSYDEGAPEGGPYRLVTKVTEGAQIEGKPEQDIKTTTTSYSGQSNLGWTLRAPTSMTTDPSGLKLTSTFVYDASTGNFLEARKPGSGGEGNPHDVKTVYYTAAANESYPACGGHPEWANMVCETLPAAQPETSGVPNLPVTTTTYNVLLEPATVTQTVGSDSRTTTNTYDEAGRLTKTSISSTVGTSLPAVTQEYEASTGLQSKTKTTVEGVTSSLVNAYNTLGQLTSYTDADGTTSTYEYDVDGRPTFVNDGKGTQSFKYSTTSGRETELLDSAVGKVTATYDVEGNLLIEKAPNGIKTSTAYNAAGEAIKVEDKKTTSCGSNCTWYSQAEVPTIHSQTASQSTTLVQDGYKYDEAGRLVEVTETPTGGGCVTRLYGFDVEDNETSLTSREPEAGKCATTGGATVNHTYDSGNRLLDTGVKYDSFGDTTTLPAADAGGSELTSTFYANSRLASLTQAGQTISYKLDPSRRTREAVATGTSSSTVVDHYSDGGDNPSWTVDLAGKWTRYIAGIGTGLLAIQYNGEAPVMQLSDLENNVVATASTSPTATALLSTSRNTEYGVPTTSSPAKYSWLGADQRPVELPSGVVAMGVRGYVPQIGRFLQMDPLTGGSANPYAYADGDPVNSPDISGAYVESDYLDEFNEEDKELAIERRIAAEEAAREEAERKAEEAAEAAEAAAAAVVERSTVRRHGRGSFQPASRSWTKINKKEHKELCPSCKGPLNKCNAECKAKKKREKQKRVKRERKQEARKREKEEWEKRPCNSVMAYHSNSAYGLRGGLYYSGQGKLAYACTTESLPDPGPGVDPPTCVTNCGGEIEGWEQWQGEDAAPPRQRAWRAVRREAQVWV